MKNPGVQTTIVYANILPTDAKMSYFENPRSLTLHDEFYMPDSFEYELGDGTVVTTSAIAPGIKWAWEHDNKHEGAKPINFAELCSSYKTRTSVFEEGDVKKVTENSYFGVQCDCEGKTRKTAKSGKACEHSKMVIQPHLIDFVLNSAIDGVFGKIGEKFEIMTDTELSEFVEKCKLFMSFEEL
jgi:hypothetical protein